MQTRIDFTTIEKLLYPYTPTIQYIPLKKGETIDAVLEMLHTEISLPKPEKEIWEEVACDLQDIERF
ncbi:MAG: hypothetical protein LBH96_03925 [Candidatus Peribacteria bacterium]|jgi:hypothetical protein|nr:hypothetical protein [Candidatus Peribacteria bacterium]